MHEGWNNPTLSPLLPLPPQMTHCFWSRNHVVCIPVALYHQTESSKESFRSVVRTMGRCCLNLLRRLPVAEGERHCQVEMGPSTKGQEEMFSP